jgi:hypothetical protein
MYQVMILKNCLLKTSFLLTLLLCLSGTETAVAQSGHVEINELTVETQRMAPETDKMTMIWWVPEEFWQAIFAQDPATTKAQAEEFLSALRPYTLFVVVDGNFGSFGAVNYKSEETIRETIQLLDAQGTSYRPLVNQNVGASTKNLLSIMRPILSNMLGQMGQNMHFFLFPAKNKAGQRLLDPRTEGSFSIKLAESAFKWRLPLGSLLAPKVCPVDGERLNGAWKFCPWHGGKLIIRPAR